MTEPEPAETPHPSWARVAWAFFVAPLVPVVLVMTGMGLWSSASGDRPWDTQFLLVTIGMMGLPIAYGPTLVVGVPAYLWLRRRLAASLAICVRGGAAVAAVAPAVMLLWAPPTSLKELGVGLLVVVAGAALGALSGVVFWLALRPTYP